MPCGSPIIRPVSISRCDPFIAMVKTSEFHDFDDGALFHDLTLNRATAFLARDEDERSG